MDSNDNTRVSSKCSSVIIKNLSIALFIFFPIAFLVIGFIYRHSCLTKPDLGMYLIIFGILILINVFIYTVLGTTFVTCIRRARSCSSERKGLRICLSSLLVIVFGIVIFIWWIIGTILWIKLTLKIKPQLSRPRSVALCQPIVYWTVLIANIFGLIGFLREICMAIDSNQRTMTNK